MTTGFVRNISLLNRVILAFEEYGAPYDLTCPKSFAKVLNHEHLGENNECRKFGAFAEMILFVTSNYLKSFQITFVMSNRSDVQEVDGRKWNDGLLDLMTRQADFTPPYYGVEYHRSHVIDFVDVPLTFQNNAIFRNPIINNPIDLFETMANSIIMLLVAIHVLCSMIIAVNDLLIDRTEPLRSCMILVVNAMYSISFLQKRTNCWKTWSKRVLITTWSASISLVLIAQVKSHFVRSLTAIEKVDVHHWRDVANLISAEGYTLLLIRSSSAAISVETSPDVTMTSLRHLLEKHPAIYFDEFSSLISYMAENPGTLAAEVAWTERVFREKVKNLRVDMLTDHAGIFINTAIRKNCSSVIRNEFKQAHFVMIQNGFIDKILGAYDLEPETKKDIYMDLLPMMTIGRNHLIIFVVGIVLATLSLAQVPSAGQQPSNHLRAP